MKNIIIIILVALLILTNRTNTLNKAVISVPPTGYIVPGECVIINYNATDKEIMTILNTWMEERVR